MRAKSAKVMLCTSVALLAVALGESPAHAQTYVPAAHAENTGKSATTLRFTKPAGAATLQPEHTPEPPRVVLSKPYVTTGYVRQELPSIATGKPYVTSGVMKVETGPGGSRQPAAATATKGPHVSLKKRIEQVCGRSARDVELLMESSNSLRVRLTVRSFTDGEKVSRQVLQLPELRPYQVAFDMQIAQ